MCIRDSYESIILTDQKDYYRGLRDESNVLKHYAKYAVSIVMINHLVSGIEAGINTKKRNTYLPKMNFYYHPFDAYLVKGVKISYEW